MPLVVVTDISKAALAVAKTNAKRHHVEHRIEFIESDWFDSLHGKFDLIISNPPYIGENELEGLEPDVIDYDPMIALTPGGDGLAPYRIIAGQAQNYLNKNGRVIVEIGHLQGNDVKNLFSECRVHGCADSAGFGWQRPRNCGKISRLIGFMSENTENFNENCICPLYRLSIRGIKSMLVDRRALSHRANFYRKSLVRYDHIMNRAMNSN